MLIDLQLHSNYSDGYLSPTELAEFISKQGIKVAALTDHNTVAGLHEFRQACRKLKIKPVTGIELYVKLNGCKLNLLWYNFDDANPELHNLLREVQVRRRFLVRKILEKLQNRGFKFDINKILDKYNHYVPINHVIDDIIANPFNFKKVKTELSAKIVREEEIISHFFKNPEIGVLHESNTNISRVFKLQKKIGGQLILCHPAKYRFMRPNTFARLKEMGLNGVEMLSPHHSFNAIMYIQHIADKYNFITSGGSDFHRFEGNKNHIQESWEYFKIDSVLLKDIKKIIG